MGKNYYGTGAYRGSPCALGVHRVEGHEVGSMGRDQMGGDCIGWEHGGPTWSPAARAAGDHGHPRARARGEFCIVHNRKVDM